ncbi:hypothetical protein AB1N83_014253 [Pleurotus pulmonarius]
MGCEGTGVRKKEDRVRRGFVAGEKAAKTEKVREDLGCRIQGIGRMKASKRWFPPSYIVSFILGRADESADGGIGDPEYFVNSTTTNPVPSTPCLFRAMGMAENASVTEYADARSPQCTPGTPGTIGVTGSVRGWEGGCERDGTVAALWLLWIRL